MFQLGKTIVSEEIIECDFVCNLSACKGACCVEGDAGAPLTEEEVDILRDIYPKVKPFLREEGIAAIEKQGTHIETVLGELETPLVDGAIDFQKPISCHLYPVRITEYSEFSALNYDRWPICDPACALGKELQVPVYKFVKTALIRKYGENWYAELEKIASRK